MIEWVDYRNYYKYLQIQKQKELDGYLIVPIRWSMELGSGKYENVMKDKFEIYRWDWTEWKKHAKFERNADRENQLAAYLGVSFDRPYTLTNKFFGSNSQFQVNIPVKGVEIRTIKGFSLFDYSKLLENAEHIHVANSSILYLLELLDLKAKSVHLYARKPQEKDFRNTQYIHTKKYVLHT